MSSLLRTPLVKCTAAAALLSASVLAQAAAWPPVPALSAHRGASALKPEMTLPSFEQALQDGADLLEVDVVLSKDGALVVRHDVALAALQVGSGQPFATTDVAHHPQFADRKTTKVVDGKEQTGWFVEDFTLAEVRTLRAIERFAKLRPANAALDRQYPLMTLQEVADVAKAYTAKTGRQVGLLLEIKHAAYLKTQGLDIGQAVLAFLQHNQWSRADAPVIVQSFEVQVLEQLRAGSPVRIFQLMMKNGGPPDLPNVTYAQMGTQAGIDKIRSYAQGVALSRNIAMESDGGRWTVPTELTQRAKAAGMQVHVWTFRPENQYLPGPYKIGSDAAARGDVLPDAKAFIDAGFDGLIADDPASLRPLFGR